MPRGPTEFQRAYSHLLRPPGSRGVRRRRREVATGGGGVRARGAGPWERAEGGLAQATAVLSKQTDVARVRPLEQECAKELENMKWSFSPKLTPTRPRRPWLRHRPSSAHRGQALDGECGPFEGAQAGVGGILESVRFQRIRWSRVAVLPTFRACTLRAHREGSERRARSGAPRASRGNRARCCALGEGADRSAGEGQSTRANINRRQHRHSTADSSTTKQLLPTS